MYEITHSLLSAWLYCMRDNPYDDAMQDDPMEDFLRVLHREPSPETEAMEKGRHFEDLVTACIHGEAPEDVWAEAAQKAAEHIRGDTPAVLQYAAKKPIQIAGYDIMLYGRLDALRGGHIYDIKYSGSYSRGKYITSTQHPMYLALVPEATDFTYVVSNGTDVWTEVYRRDETPNIVDVVKDFLVWLEATGLVDLYRAEWQW